MEKKLNTQHKDTRHDKGQFQKDSRGTKDGELVIDPTKYRYIRALKNSMVKWRRTRAFSFSLSISNNNPRRWRTIRKM